MTLEVTRPATPHPAPWAFLSGSSSRSHLGSPASGAPRLPQLHQWELVCDSQALKPVARPIFLTGIPVGASARCVPRAQASHAASLPLLS